MAIEVPSPEVVHPVATGPSTTSTLLSVGMLGVTGVAIGIAILGLSFKGTTAS